MEEEYNDIKTRLMTLLNVSNLRAMEGNPDVSTSPYLRDPRKRVKLNQRSTQVAEPLPDSTNDADVPISEGAVENDTDVEVENDTDVLGDDQEDASTRHFGPASAVLTEEARRKVDAGLWSTSVTKTANFGGSSVVNLNVEDGPNSEGIQTLLTPKLLQVNKNEILSIPADLRSMRASLLEQALKAKDIYIPHVRLNEHAIVRKTLSLVLLNHILKIRRTLLKNNDRIAAATAKSQDPPDDVRDQGFTRPSILVLVPFRNSALALLQAFLDHFTASISQTGDGEPQKSRGAQVHHYSRFISQYSLPPDAVDKLATAEPGVHPPDHVQTFSGNIDDNFKIGVKVMKKSVRLFEAFYGADLIVASPLGLRLAIEKEGNADFLSSIEIAVVDQIDVLLMQNWDHVHFVFQRMNKIPKDSHGADFSRIKPWYLDEHAAYLRQTIMLSQYDTPEGRAFFKSLKNVDGKLRSTTSWDALQAPADLDQKFIKFEASTPKEEADKRFDHFTKKLFPAVLRSAVQSAGAMIFVPSYFDFVRVQNWMKKNGTACAYLSEYTTPQNISRARRAFFSGAKPFLVMTERFHFFRRYRLRGVRNIIFYGAPEHGQFYSEFLTFPFLDEGVEPSDVTVKLLYSKYDMMRIERIVGTNAVDALVR